MFPQRRPGFPTQALRPKFPLCPSEVIPSSENQNLVKRVIVVAASFPQRAP